MIYNLSNFNSNLEYTSMYWVFFERDDWLAHQCKSNFWRLAPVSLGGLVIVCILFTKVHHGDL